MNVAVRAGLGGERPAAPPGSRESVHATYVRARLALLRERCRGAVETRRHDDPDPDDHFRGLYVTEEQVVGYLSDQAGATPLVEPGRDELERWADEFEASGTELRLRAVGRRFELLPLDLDVLLAAMAPDLDPRFEKIFGYLHDDVTRRRASIGLTLELAGADPVHSEARSRLMAGAPLFAAGLLMCEDADRPFLTRSLRAPDEVVAYVLGSDTPDADLVAFEGEATRLDGARPGSLAAGLRAGASLVYLRDRIGAAALAYAVTATEDAGLIPLVVDLERLDVRDDPAVAETLARVVVRRARLDGRVVIAGPIDALADRGAAAVRPFAESGAPTVLIGSMGWDPAWSRRVPLVIDAPELAALGAASLSSGLPFRLTPEQVVRARRAACLHALADGVAVDDHYLAIGARAQNAAGLERLALRIAPTAGWDDLVLPDPVLRQLHELVARVRHRDVVLQEWGLRRGSSRGRGVTALFAGDSGTGKTLSAEIVSAALGLDLYVVDLATVVDKYIGETEKNLDRIFREADRVNGVLLFDEADAIFGKRSEVQDARDRYANVEVAYLLQRMERFDGIAILTTNLRANLDDAFLRRLDCLIDFPVPDEAMRAQLWERHLPPGVPRESSVDIGFLASAFDLPGGNIRNIALAAAFLAAAEGTPVTMSTLIRATAREYRKLGRLLVESEFGRYHSLLNHPRGDDVNVR